MLVYGLIVWYYDSGWITLKVQAAHASTALIIYVYTILYGVTSQKTLIVINSATRTPNLEQ